MTKKQLLKIQKQRRKERKKRNFIGLTVFVIVSVIIITPLYKEANKERVCSINSIQENKIVVKHPNDLLYSFETDNPEHFKENTMITVIFDELTDWEKNYIIKGVKQND